MCPSNLLAPIESLQHEQLNRNISQSSKEEMKSESGHEKYKVKVALKILEKKRFADSDEGFEILLNEIRIHWILEQCEGVLKLLGIHEDQNFIVLALEY